MTSEQVVRNQIARSLERLSEDLDRFVQTTHASICFGTPRELGEALNECLENPTAFAISELVQAAEKLAQVYREREKQ